MMAEDDPVKKARECVGARFRPQGRGGDEGLDCIGLAIHAYLPRDGAKRMPRRYRLRGTEPGTMIEEIEAAGFWRVSAQMARPGDMLLMAAGVRQPHVAVLTETGFIHADAGRRCVVETPGRPPWPVVAAFRWGNG